MVGVNTLTGDVGDDAGDPARLARSRGGAAGAGRRRRRASATRQRWTRRYRDGRGRRADRNIVPPMLEAVRAEATLGEICDAFRPLSGRVPGAGAVRSPPAPPRTPGESPRMPA